MSETNPPAIVIEKSANVVMARVHSKSLDESDLKLLRQMIDDAAAAPGVTLVVIDLSKVQMLPSLGLGVLVQLASKCKSRDQRLKLAAMTPTVRQVFTITKLDRVLDLANSVEAAIEG